MKTRFFSAVVYLAILAVAYLLKVFVHDLCFDVLTYVFALLGTREIVNAVGANLTKSQKGLVFAFAGLCIPATAVAELYRLGAQASLFCFFVFAVLNLCLFVVKHEETTPKNIGESLFCAVYPTLMLVPLVLVNHIPDTAIMQKYAFNSNLAIFLILVISPISDTFAYFFGKFLRGKFPKKMAASVSPNKTVIGAIGGIIGGIVGAAGVYFVYNAFFGSFDNMLVWLLIYALIGIVASAANEFGDLVESGIKRKVGIKDMGKIMPGHGGILDRIDGTLFTTVVVYFVFLLVFFITAI
ncbi:MAG: phosphatidate cytidylyltransferase [Clostridia bacterium]|nr:phosphatidate cytidylyltransferase [Clostridia bacterium]